MSNSNSYINSIPLEILNYIFTKLSAYDLIKSRAVCLRWQVIIDGLVSSKMFWRRLCRQDFPDIYESAYSKSSCMHWYLLYRSLTLWPKLQHVLITTKDFATSNYDQDQILDFILLKNKFVGVLTIQNIEYYDQSTLQKEQDRRVVGDFIRYSENENVLLLLYDNLRLAITWKSNSKSGSIAVEYSNVATFIVINNVIYYLKKNSRLYKCVLINDIVTNTEILSVPLGTIALSNLNESLHILVCCDIYKLVDNELIRVLKFVPNKTNIYQEFKKHNLLQDIDWWENFNFYASLEAGYSEHLTTNIGITVILPYGHITFAGTNASKLYVYYTKSIDRLIDLCRAEPLIVYDFEPGCTPEFEWPILQVDIVEGEDSHILYVAMLTRITAMTIVHGCIRAALLSNPSSVDTKSNVLK